MLLSTSPSVNGYIMKSNLIDFFTDNTWIVLIACILDILLIIRTLIRRKTQEADENDITNMFTDAGKKNEHLEHKEYNITTKLFLAVVLGFAYIALKTMA